MSVEPGRQRCSRTALLQCRTVFTCLSVSSDSGQHLSARHGIEAVVVREEEVQGAFFSFQEFIWEMKDGGDGGGLAESDTPIANACVAALPMYG